MKQTSIVCVVVISLYACRPELTSNDTKRIISESWEFQHQWHLCLPPHLIGRGLRDGWFVKVPQQNGPWPPFDNLALTQRAKPLFEILEPVNYVDAPGQAPGLGAKVRVRNGLPRRVLAMIGLRLFEGRPDLRAARFSWIYDPIPAQLAPWVEERNGTHSGAVSMQFRNGYWQILSVRVSPPDPVNCGGSSGRPE